MDGLTTNWWGHTLIYKTVYDEGLSSDAPSFIIYTLINITTMNYTEEINSAPVVLVEFYATWCPHCRKMMPIMEDIKTLLAGELKVLQYDIDKNEELANQQRVQSLPTFLLYADGKEVMRETGEMPGEVLLQKIQAAIQ